jgi:hypothetical protein
LTTNVCRVGDTWKESTDPNKEAKLDRIEQVTNAFPDRCFAFDQFGPLSIRPHHGSSWSPTKRPDRLPATYTRTHGIRYLHGCYSLGDDQLWGSLSDLWPLLHLERAFGVRVGVVRWR